MERLMKIAHDIGPNIMSLTVQKSNARAVILYQKMGFQIIREQLRGGDNEPEYYMERTVR
jgi:ribosomal protein S18 acetylase RimI-like enzyme